MALINDPIDRDRVRQWLGGQIKDAQRAKDNARCEAEKDVAELRIGITLDLFMPLVGESK
jgi:hypothetical protein